MDVIAFISDLIFPYKCTMDQTQWTGKCLVTIEHDHSSHWGFGNFPNVTTLLALLYLFKFCRILLLIYGITLFLRTCFMIL